MNYLKETKITETENRKVVTGGWEEGRGKLVLSGYRVSVLPRQKSSRDPVATAMGRDLT